MLKHKLFFYVFLFFFLSTLTIATLIQTIILPYLIPSIHGGNGLLIGGDWLGFHLNALELKELVETNGWGSFNLKYRGQAPVGIAGFFYLIFFPKPLALLPLNCFFHSLGGIVVFIILSNLTKNKIVCFVGSLCYVFFPSSLLFYTQIHKDVFFHPGVLLLILSWVIFSSYLQGYRKNYFILSLISIFSSFVIIQIVRPYYLDVIVGIDLILTFITICYILFQYLFLKKTLKLYNIFLIFIYLFIVNSSIILFSVNDFSGSIGYKKAVYNKILTDNIVGGRSIDFAAEFEVLINDSTVVSETTDNTVNKEDADDQASDRPDNMSRYRKFDEKIKYLEKLNLKKTVIVTWEDANYLHPKLNYILKQMYYYREYFFLKQGNAKMTFTQEYPLNNLKEMILFIPKALYYGYLSPFPNTWFEKGSTSATSAMRSIMSFEMMIVYLLLPSLILAIFRNYHDLTYIFVIVICNTFIVLPTYILPNVGVLLRHRYGCFVLLVGLSFASFYKFFFKNKI